MRLTIDAAPEELQEKGDALVKALVRTVAPLAPELAERLEKALPEPPLQLRYRALRDIHKITKDAYRKMLDDMHLDISRVLSAAADGPSIGHAFQKSYGEQRAGHKYIKREGSPGHYTYVYPNTEDSHAGYGTHSPEELGITPQMARGLLSGEIALPAGAFVHGRRKAQALSDDWPTQLTRDIRVAQQYSTRPGTADSPGSVWVVSPAKATSVAEFHAANTSDMDGFAQALASRYAAALADQQQDEPIWALVENIAAQREVSPETLPWEEFESVIRREFAPEEIVTTAQAYDSNEMMALLEYYPGGYPDLITLPNDTAVMLPGSKTKVHAVNLSAIAATEDQGSTQEIQKAMPEELISTAKLIKAWGHPDLCKAMAGPFIGPRGGKWADPEHTIPWHEGVPAEQLEEQAHAVVKPHVAAGAMRAAAVGADAQSLKYVGAGAEGMIFEDNQGRAYKVSRGKSAARPNQLRNEAEAMQSLAGTPAADFVPRVHGYDPQHDVITREMISGASAGWGQSAMLREKYKIIAEALAKKDWTAPEFKEDSFIVPADGGAPIMVDMGFVHPTGKRLARRLKEEVQHINPGASWFDFQLDVSHAYGDGAIDAQTALDYLDRGSKGIKGVADSDLAHARDIVQTIAHRRGDIQEGQSWKDIAPLDKGRDVQVGHKFDVKLNPAIFGGEPRTETYHVTQVDGDNVKLSRHEGSDFGPTIPRASLKHFVNDLEGKVDLPPSGNPDIDAVTSGKAKLLGKGDDGLAFKVGDKVVKVSTTVPYQPDNPGHRTPEKAAAMLKQQVDIGNKLADEGVPGIQRSEFVKHGDKGFQIKPWVEIPEKFTREQLDAVQDSLIAMHKKGYALNDEPQAGLDATGKPVMFDVGKAAIIAGKGFFSDTEQDFDRLRSLYQKHGQEMVRRDYSQGQKRMDHFTQNVDKWTQGDKPNRKFARYNLDNAVKELEREAKATLSGPALDKELASIKSHAEFQQAVIGEDAPAKPALELTPHPAPKAKPKRTPVPITPPEDEAAKPLPGQLALLGGPPTPGKRKVRKPVQHEMFAVPEKQKPEDKPLPGQLPLLRR